MLQYLKYFIYIWLGFYILVNWTFRGKVSIGFISWLQLINVKINLSLLKISIGSVSLQIRPLYYLHRKNLKATHHDGLIVIHFYKLGIDTSSGNTSISLPKTKASNKKTTNLKTFIDSCDATQIKDDNGSPNTEKLIKILQWLRWVLPLTVVIHNLSIISGDKWLNIETLSVSFNCDMETSKFTKKRQLRNSVHFSLSNLSCENRKLIKDLKWTFIGCTPLTDVCSAKFSQLISQCVVHGININIGELKQLINDIKPKKDQQKNQTDDASIDIQKGIPYDSIEDYLEKIDKSDIYFAFDDSKIEIDDKTILLKNMVYSFNSADNKELIYKKYSGSKLYKSTINMSGLRIHSDILKHSKLNMEFLNFFTIWDLKSILFAVKNINNTEVIKRFTDDDTFIARNFLTITNITLFTNLDDILHLQELRKLKKNKSISKQIDLQNIEELASNLKGTDDDNKNDESNNILENILRLTHKLRTRAQFLTTMVQIKLSDSLNSQFLVDDILLDSSLTDNLSSLFEVDSSFTPTKSIFLAIRNVQFSLVEEFKIHKLFIIDLFDASFSIGIIDDSVIVDQITLYIHHIEFLAEDIDVFKKLSAISSELVNRKNASAEPLEILNDERENESKEKSGFSKSRKDTIIPKFIRSLKFSIHRITLTSCFKNPVKYWDGEDQTSINDYKRGISVSLLELVYFHDNKITNPISDVKLSEFSVYLIRDYDEEKHKQKFTKFLNLTKYNLKYTYFNHSLSMVLPIIDVTLSVEVLWTILFVITVLKSVKGRKENKMEGSTNDIHKSKKNNDLPLNILVSLPLLMLKLKLPSDVDVTFELDSLQFSNIPLINEYKELNFKVFRIYGQNPHADCMWTLLTIISNGKFKINSTSAVLQGKEKIIAICDDIRIEIPYEYVFYKTFDNLKAFFKSIKKLNKNFYNLMYTEDSDKSFKVDVILPSLVEKPFRLPRMQIRSKRIFYCNHDDPFEEELTRVLMLSRMEQVLRLSKLEEFAKYEENMLKILKKKYDGLLEFKDGKPVIPSILKNGVQGMIPSKDKSTPMKKSLSTGIVSSKMNRNRNSSFSVGTNSNLSNQVFDDECEAWLDYQREYHTSIEIPRNRLNSNISKSWITKVRTSKRMKESIKESISCLKTDPKVRKEFFKKYPIVVEGNFQPLFGFKVINAVLDLDEPEFGLENYADFMHRVAGGMPKDMKYGILVPMNLKLSCSELNVQIKDYPLPLLGFGGAKDDGNDAVKIAGDIVICEQEYSMNEIRFNFVPCVPQYNDPRSKDNLYAFHIARTMTNVKFVTDLNVFVDSPKPAAVSWSPSLKPGMGYAFDSFDLLSKPPLDISSKIGFWDKMPLLVPSKFSFFLKHGIVLFIKSSQSPYHLIGKNAGLAFKWDKDVKIKINSNNKSEDFLIVESEIFEIGVPVFDPTYIASLLNHGMGTAIDYKMAKVLLRLTSKPIIWKLGFVFERNLTNEKHVKPGSVERTRNFRPHYDIQLRNPDTFSSDEEKELWDSYEGWRSDYIYLAVSLYSRDDNKCKMLPNVPLGTAYNSLYLTPMAIYYFFYWWHSFKSSLGLPIKGGKLFKNDFLSDAKSPKFGATIFGLSYTVDLSPLYLTHVYQHSSSDHNDAKVAFTGLKCFVKSFTMDLHQSRKETIILDDKTNTVSREYNLKMDKGIVDFVDADLRILTAVFNQTSATGMLAGQLGLDKATSFLDTDTSSSTSDEYMNRIWYDHDDFIELESQTIPTEEPKWKLYEFASSPRFYYVRDTPSEPLDFPFDSVESQTHMCQLGERDLSHAASNLTDTRISELEEQISFSNLEIKDLESKERNDYSNKRLVKLKSDLQELHHRLHILRCLKDKFSEGIFPEYDEFLNDGEESDDEIEYELSKVASRVSSHISRCKSVISTAPIQSSNYRNRFSVYTINVNWTPHVKSGFLRYLEKVKDRKFLVFSLSQQALNLALDLKKTAKSAFEKDDEFSFLESNPQLEFEKSKDILNDFDQVLHDTTGFLEAETDDSYLLKFILPQISVASNNSKCVLLTSNQIVLRSVTVSGFNIDESVNEITRPMETRNALTITDAFVYVLEKENVLTNQHQLFTQRSLLWPPKLPLEIYYTPISLDECVVVQDLSFAVLFIKPNQLHYSKNDKNSNARCKETIRVVAPDVNIMADSSQYSTLYEIFNSLMKHDETDIYKVKEAVKNFIKYTDFADFDQLYRDLEELQNKSRKLSECRRLLVNVNYSEDIDVMDDIESVNVELEKVLLNLNAIVDILQTSKAKRYTEYHEYVQWNIMAPSIKLLLVGDNKTPFVEFNAIDAYYMFTESPNGESTNTVYVYDFEILDKHVEADYETVLTRSSEKDEELLRLDWTLLAPVGGIKVIENKNFSFAPMKIEFDMRFADALQEFLFPKSKVLQKNDVFGDDADTSDLFDDLDSLDSNSSSLSRVNSISSQTTVQSNEKDGSKISRVFQKILPKHTSKHNSPSSSISSVLSRSSTENGRISSSTTLANQSEEANCSHNRIKVMQERASKYYMAKQVKINAMNLCITFKGSGKWRLINLTDFNVKTPTIEINNKIMSNEELFAVVRNKLVVFVLRNTHNIIKSTLKVNKSSKRKSSNNKTNAILKIKGRDNAKKTSNINSSHSHKHHLDNHGFHDTELLEPNLTELKNGNAKKKISLTELNRKDKLLSGVDESKVFEELDDVVEEEEGECDN